MHKISIKVPIRQKYEIVIQNSVNTSFANVENDSYCTEYTSRHFISTPSDKQIFNQMKRRPDWKSKIKS